MDEARQKLINSFNKVLGIRAAISCEWCERTDDLTPWDSRPDSEPSMESLLLLCGRCRDMAEKKRCVPDELRSIENALWSSIPVAAESAARVLSRSTEPWAREAIEACPIDEVVKRELLSSLKTIEVTNRQS